MAASPRGRCSVIVGVLAGLLCTEAVARSRWLRERPVPHATASMLYRKMAWLSAQPVPDVLVLGDSTGLCDIDAPALARGFDVPAATRVRNGSLAGGSPIVARAVYRAAPKPLKTVVLAGVSIDLDDTLPPPAQEIEAATFTERLELSSIGAAVLSATWMTFRRRQLLRLAFMHSIRHAGRAEVFDDPTRRAYVFGGTVRFEDELGSLVLDGTPLELEAHARAIVARGRLNDGPPRIGARQRALGELVRAMRSDGIDVVYVRMPLSSPLRRLLAPREPILAAAARSAVEQSGGRLLDCSDSVPDREFYDADHLRAGRARAAFSEMIGALVAQHATSCLRLVEP